MPKFIVFLWNCVSISLKPLPFMASLKFSTGVSNLSQRWPNLIVWKRPRTTSLLMTFLKYGVVQGVFSWSLSKNTALRRFLSSYSLLAHQNETGNVSRSEKPPSLRNRTEMQALAGRTQHHLKPNPRAMRIVLAGRTLDILGLRGCLLMSSRLLTKSYIGWLRQHNNHLDFEA